MKVRKKRFISGGICLLFAVAVILAARLFMVWAENGTMTDGETIEYVHKNPDAALGTPENPFTVLEIVPNKSMAMAGYMIPGCEPIDMEALSGDYETGLWFSQELVGNAGLYEQKENRYKYAFWDGIAEGEEICTEPGNYQNTFGTWCEYSSADIGYSETGYYENVGSGNGSFARTEEGNFEPLAGGEYRWVKTGCYYPVSDGSGTYNRIWDAGAGAYLFVQEEGGPYAFMSTETEEGGSSSAGGEVFFAVRTDAVYYQAKYYNFVNRDCLVQHAFDEVSSFEGFSSQVVTVTPDELTDGNLPIIQNADMIIITAQDYCVKFWGKYNKQHLTLEEEQQKGVTFNGAGGNDLTWNAAAAIVNRMASENPAAMILEYSVMKSKTDDFNYNMEKLYMMLMQYGAKAFKAGFMDDAENFVTKDVTVDGRTFITGAYNNPYKNTGDKSFATTWTATTFLTDMDALVMHESAFATVQNEIYNTILTYNGDQSFLWEFLREDKIGESKPHGDRWTQYASNSEVFDWYQEENGTRPEHISMNDAAKYILRNASDKNGFKKKLHILEVQPCNQFIYGNRGWQLYYLSMLPWYTGDLEKDLTVTTMTSYQLIGDITDLNSEYDMVIFGAKQDSTNGKDGYNDSSLGNLVYTSVGDLVMRNWYSPESSDGRDAKAAGVRYSGNDITRKKYEELKDFLTAGKPVLISAEFYDGYAVKQDKVDTSSYICRLLAEVNDGSEGKPPLFKERAYYSAQGNDLLKKAVARETCAIELSEIPQPYYAVTEDTDAGKGVIREEVYNNSVNENGDPILSYSFTLAGISGKSYGVKLYIDRDGNGIYENSMKEKVEKKAFLGGDVDTSDSEEVSGVRVYRMAEDGSYAEIGTDTLTPGNSYKVVRTVPASERGILPWKLEIYQTDNWSNRCSAINYTAVKASSTEKVKINVLQMNLTKDMKSNAYTYVNFADTKTQTGAKFAAYLEGVWDFDVSLSFLQNTEWYEEFGMGGTYAKKTGETGDALKDLLTRKWEEYLENVDMLVIGYVDMAQFTSDDIFYAGFMDFVDQGKSVILSHDLVKDPATLGSVGTKYDSDIRTLSGQRRKYYVDDTNYYEFSWDLSRGNKVTFSNQSTKYKSKVPTNIPETEAPGYTAAWAGSADGFYNDYGSEFMDNSNRLLLYYGGSSYNQRDRILTEFGSSSSLIGRKDTTWVEVANQGQITNYPYDIPDVIPVATTHTQNFQLDLEQSDGGDVTVWYNLTDQFDSDVTENGSNGGVYSSKQGDSRNNFYIYTKGNITYTGLGHSQGTLTDDEVKLFVNTMISAYRRIPEKPYITITNDDVSLYQGVYTLYHMMTGAEDEESGKLEVNFKVLDEDMTAGNKRVYTMRFKDEKGDVLSEQKAVYDRDAGTWLVYGENGYSVRKDGSYMFEVPYKLIGDNGEATYYLECSSVYWKGEKPVETNRTTKVIIYGMPLFDLS